MGTAAEKILEKAPRLFPMKFVKTAVILLPTTRYVTQSLYLIQFYYVQSSAFDIMTCSLRTGECKTKRRQNFLKNNFILRVASNLTLYDLALQLETRFFLYFFAYLFYSQYTFISIDIND